METDAEGGTIRNDVLSQSYAECVERVAQQKNDRGFSFDLPKEILEEREKEWDNFFLKYSDEVSDEVQLDMNTMKPVAGEDEEEDEDEEDDDEEDDEKEYYSKCRAPLRKLPALIQYWIDTGNPPYQLVGDDDHTETGSSLSEGEHSKSGRSAILRESSDKHKSNTSRCSSVDTAAYILSNTNITKKAETMAIVEGAKSPDEHFVSKAFPLKEILAESVEMTNNAIIPSPNRGQKSPDKIVQAATPIAAKVGPEFEKASMTSTLKDPLTNRSILLASKPLEISSPGQQSVKLSEILPELQKFDEMLKRSKAMSPPRTRISLAQIRRKPKRVRSADAVDDASQSSQNSPIFSNSQNKLQHRRRLYTGRDSPVDLVVEKPNGEVVQTTRRSLHPALETTITRDDKAKRLAARARARRKRKRASQISEINNQNGNASQETNRSIGDENLKGDVRYTDFFESLGLTPSNMAVSKARDKKPTAKRLKKIERQILPRKAKDVAPVNDSAESSMKESENASHTEDFDFPPVGENQNLREKPVEKIVGDRVLIVRIERLSDECLARYCRNVTSGSTENMKFKTESQICTTSASSSPGKKGRHSNLEKIELLTTLTHDSDSSTILICSCNENDGQCQSDDLLSKNVSQYKKMSLRNGGLKLPRKAGTDAVKSKITENLDHNLPDAFVKLEKLKINNLEKCMKTTNNSRKTRKSNEFIAPKDSKIVFETFLRPQSPRVESPVRNGTKIDLFGSNVSGSVTIGSQIFGESNCGDAAEKTRQKSFATRTRCSLGISIPSDEEEDSFVKIVSEIGSTRDSTKLEEASREEMKKMNDSNKTQNLRNESGKIQTEKPHKFFPISTSSDEEDVYVRESKRRTRNLDSQNEKNRRGRRKTQGDLVKEVKNEEEAVKMNNRFDESNRRKLPKDEAAEDEGEVEVENGKTRGSKGRCKSTRPKFSASWPPKNQIPAKNSFTKPKDAKNLFRISQEPGLKDVGVLPAWDNRDLGLKDENFDAESGLEITDQSEKSKSRTTTRDEKKIVRNSLRFQTRLDSDSDSEFEGLRFSLNTKYVQRNPKEQSDDGKIAKPNGVAVSYENEPENEETKMICTSPRRIFKSLLDRRREVGETKIRKRGRNLFDEESKSTENGVDSRKNEAMDVEASWNNELLLLNDFPKNETKDSRGKQRKNRLKGESQEERRSRKNFTKFDRSKNQSAIANQRNGEFWASPRAKKKKVRRTRILGNLMEWESDDDTDSNENNVNSNNVKKGKGLESQMNGDSSKRLNDKDANDDRESSRRQESMKNLFSNNFDDLAEDVDLLFSGNAKSRGAKNAIVIDKLNFASTKKHRNRSNVGLSTMSFRTRLRSDTEDDGES